MRERGSPDQGPHRGGHDPDEVGPRLGANDRSAPETQASASSRVGVLTRCDELGDRLAAVGEDLGFSFARAESSGRLLELADAHSIDLALLHWESSEFEALDCCAALRRSPASFMLPVLVMSDWSQASACARALDAGADDCMFAPFSDQEISFRIAKTLRRPKPSRVGAFLTYQDIVMDLDRWRVLRRGRPVALSTAEFKLLRALIENPSQVLSRERLVEIVCRDPAQVDPQAINVYVGRLRRALAQVGPGDPIRAVRGKGYALDVDDYARSSAAADGLERDQEG